MYINGGAAERTRICAGERVAPSNATNKNGEWRMQGSGRSARRVAALAAIVAGCASHVGLGAQPVGAPLACDEGIKAAFKPDSLTTVIAAKAFKKDDPLVITEPVTPATP